MTAAQKANAALIGAFRSPLNIGELSVSAAPVRKGDRISFTLDVQPAEFGLAETPGGVEGVIDIMARFTASDGKQAGEMITRTVQLRMAAPNYQAAVKDGLTLRGEEAIPANAGSLRILVRSRASGRIGTVTAPMSQIPSIQ